LNLETKKNLLRFEIRIQKQEFIFTFLKQTLRRHPACIDPATTGIYCSWKSRSLKFKHVITACVLLSLLRDRQS